MAYKLTPKENEVIACLISGYVSHKEIAAKMRISTGTVRSHLHNIYNKTDIDKRDKTSLVNAVYAGKIETEF